MPATLTLGANSYELTDNTNFATQYPAVSLAGADNITVVGSVANYGLDTSTGADTLLISATLTGGTISTGGNTDFITVGGSVSNSTISGGSANDTLIIAANASGTTFSGGNNMDSITLNAGVTLTGGTIQGGNQNISADADTITLSGAGSGTLIATFSKSYDTLVIGSNVITSADWAGTTSNINTVYSSIAYTGVNADIQALNDWLAAGGNTITLI
jgi:hypothetical protein